MKVIQPQMQAIQEKYANDPQKQQEAMMKLYREAKVNPLGGCLPMLLQYPILIALWQFLPQAIELRQQGFLWAADLSAPDPILHLPFTIPLYGNFVAGFTLLMGLAMIIQMRVQMQSQPSNPQTAVFTYVFPVMLFVIFNKLASGLNLYYLVFNLISVLHQQWYNRKAVPVAPLAVASNGKDPKTPAPAPKPARPKKTKS
jgi:YidC/Oxa1 family membrane protein insertase